MTRQYNSSPTMYVTGSQAVPMPCASGAEKPCSMNNDEEMQDRTADPLPLSPVIGLLLVSMLLGMLLYVLGEANLLLTVAGCCCLLLVGCAVYSAWRIWTYTQVTDEYATIPEMPALRPYTKKGRTS